MISGMGEESKEKFRQKTKKESKGQSITTTSS